MTALDREFEIELARLSAAFIAELPLKVQAVGDDMTAWLAEPQDAERYERLCHRVHQLKGAGSTFGCQGVSDAARSLEIELAKIKTAAAADVERARREAEAAIQRLWQAAAAPGESVP
jgi:HPt (histidine-containing phosphotransfer) domain-containing protein